MTWLYETGNYEWNGRQTGRPSFRVGLEQISTGGSEWLTSCQKPLPVLSVFKLKSTSVFPKANGIELQHYVRGQDLVIESPYSEYTPTGVQRYWRPELVTDGGLDLECWVSANTRLLDERIDWTLSSEFLAKSVWQGVTNSYGQIDSWRELFPGIMDLAVPELAWGEPFCGQHVLMLELANGCGYVAMACAPGDLERLVIQWDQDPGDLDTEASLSAAGHLLINHQLRMGFLEKGVIRRARAFLTWIPNVPDAISLATQRLTNFFLSPQPLTV